MQFIVIYCYFIVINVIDLIVIKFVLKPGNWRQNGRIRGRIRKSLKMEAIFLGAIFFWWVSVDVIFLRWLGGLV